MGTSASLSFPIGSFDASAPVDAAMREPALMAIAELPARLRDAVGGLSEAQLDTPYRPRGWTVRQVVHHLADSHMNGFIRMKLALTEDLPTIKAYDEKSWAALPDSVLPIGLSLDILSGLHVRWTALFPLLTDREYARAFFHPERGHAMTIDTHLQMYAWHSKHHVAHITALRHREGW